ncbi:MAG: ABC transporter ATP-binding protein [Pseudomonadota bacterium]
MSDAPAERRVEPTAAQGVDAATNDASREREALLSVRDLCVHFSGPSGPIRAVDGISLDLYPGETVALVGESGCGKSTLARTLVGLTTPTRGSIRFRGTELRGANRAALRALRKDVQLVFQDPYASLNPRLTIRATLAEALLLHGRATPNDVDRKISELLEQVGLDPELRFRYPHEFSGGQRQRISIARALSVSPKLLLCDEVTSALDVSIQAQILELLKRLQRELGIAYLFVTHDLGIVRYIAHRVAVMYLGQIVELRASEALFTAPSHPYTRALVASSPRIGAASKGSVPLLGGEVPSPARPPSGCRFHPRCPERFDPCPREAPELYALADGGQSRCFLCRKA